MKDLLNAAHRIIRFLAHAALVPVMALLKAIDAACQHLISELSKV